MLSRLTNAFSPSTSPSALLVLGEFGSTIHILHLLPENSINERFSITTSSSATTFHCNGATEQGREQIGTVTLHVGDGETADSFLDDVETRIHKLRGDPSGSSPAQQQTGTVNRNDVPTVVVIGAGILGLTSAIKIQEAVAARKADVGGHLQVLLVSREWPSSIPGSPSKHSPNYASMWAGAHVRPIPATTAQLRREAEWLKQTVAEFSTQLQTEPWSGITRTLGIELLEAPDDGYQKQDAKSFSEETGLLRYRKWSEAELPENVVLGYEYETYCVNTPVYCQSLLRRFILRGGRTLKRDLKTEWEAFGLQKNVVLVVNASGTGFGDPKYFPTRGQTVVTDMEDATKTVTRQHKDGTWSFIIPRFFSGGTIVGGTKQPGDWSAEPDANTRATLLAGGRELRQFASSLAGKSDDVSVIADVVGRRPTREGGMRIELERQPVSGRQAAVLHAYGAGGRGYEIGWGVANEIAQLVNKFLIEESPLASKL
ncbi:D-amino-acid oxidase [Beauveria bassiana D1-5]|uniref:D-amino-acid oxidase n=1 Tax=Beauveria bassiana D1-5 TaxID=1245745 RepID=A0A0A2VVT3_BEABA|nr:D-amino-acid oxidase [Beauveria bassiana D1-5]